ncbi:hypothetical protein [Halopiger djelfimassiliensis]|uniref:hypothetical protein n=1 Tax=Halopiger djelfimassiliensis TaxID=1293047 RepID=UPI000677E8D7|nr:hypothetical protein [Halopiger djelfimassiliensis]
MLPDSPLGRLEWAFRESLVIFGILLLWVGVAIVATLATRIFGITVEATIELIGGQAVPPMAELLRLTEHLWEAVVPITLVTATLYVLVRAGTLLIDHYHRTAR